MREGDRTAVGRTCDKGMIQKCVLIALSELEEASAICACWAAVDFSSPAARANVKE